MSSYQTILSLKEQIKCNILLIGKTGTGKSSFANYLFDTDIFTTGSGEPVTGWEDNFQRHSFIVSNVSVNVYDSVGLEPNNFDRWTDELNTFLSEFQPDEWGNVKSPNDIMHTLFYVINGASARVEENEMIILEKIRDNHDLSASIIITNCDEAKENEIIAIENKVKKHNLIPFRVCSISKKTRGGDKKDPFGKEPAIRQILSASYEKVGKELTLSALNGTIDFLDSKRKELKASIDASDISIFNLNAMDNIDFDAIFGDDIEMEDLIPPEYRNYQEFLDGFDIDYQGKDILEESFDSIRNIVESISIDSFSIGRKINKIEGAFEYGNIFDKIGAIFQVGGMALTVRKTIKDGIDEIVDLFIDKLFWQRYKLISNEDWVQQINL